MISLAPEGTQIPAGCQGARRSARPIESISELLKQGEIDTHGVEPSMLLSVVSDLASLFFNSWKDQTIAAHKASLKLSSFSETGNSIVMWSHYAAPHTGFCIEYSVHALPADNLTRRFLFPVIYSKDLIDATKYCEIIGGDT